MRANFDECSSSPSLDEIFEQFFKSAQEGDSNNTDPAERQICQHAAVPFTCLHDDIMQEIWGRVNPTSYYPLMMACRQTYRHSCEQKVWQDIIEHMPIEYMPNALTLKVSTCHDTSSTLMKKIDALNTTSCEARERTELENASNQIHIREAEMKLRDQKLRFCCMFEIPYDLKWLNTTSTDEIISIANAKCVNACAKLVAFQESRDAQVEKYTRLIQQRAEEHEQECATHKLQLDQYQNKLLTLQEIIAFCRLKMVYKENVPLKTLREAAKNDAKCSVEEYDKCKRCYIPSCGYSALNYILIQLHQSAEKWWDISDYHYAKILWFASGLPYHNTHQEHYKTGMERYCNNTVVRDAIESAYVYFNSTGQTQYSTVVSLMKALL